MRGVMGAQRKRLVEHLDRVDFRPNERAPDDKRARPFRSYRSYVYEHKAIKKA